jgi:hypothetical protein
VKQVALFLENHHRLQTTTLGILPAAMARPRFTDEALVKLTSFDGSHRTRRILLTKDQPDMRIGRTSKKRFRPWCR